MAEIRVEPRRRSWTTVALLILGLAILCAVLYYVFLYRTG